MSLVLSSDGLDRLYDFMHERHLIWMRRNAGQPFPWTTDPILGNQFFTNVYRELDKDTIWIRDNVRQPFGDNPNLPQMLALCRWFGDTGFLGDIIDSPKTFPLDRPMDDFMMSAIRAVASRRSREGKKNWTSAYMIGTAGNSMPKELYCVQRAREASVLTLENCTSLEAAWTLLSGMKGWAGNGFMAYELVTDLRHTKWLRDAPDVQSWANAGPGAQRGLRRVCKPTQLFPHDLERKVPAALANVLMNSILTDERFQRRWYSSFSNKYPKPELLEMREIEHSLCEFDKYERCRLHQGRSKRRYTGPEK